MSHASDKELPRRRETDNVLLRAKIYKETKRVIESNAEWMSKGGSRQKLTLSQEQD